MDEKHENIIRAFTKDYAYNEDQRDLANEDIRFIVVPGGQWEGFLEQAYGSRPRMEYDMVVQAVDRFMGEWSTNELMPKFRDEDADDQDEAELIDGLFRRMWRKEGGKQSAKNAVFEVAAGGFGAVRLGTRYLDEYAVDDDRQEITFSPIYSAHSTVVYDCNAKMIDKRDANHVSLLLEYSRDEFERKWPNIEPVSAAGKDDRREFNWVTGDSVFVLEHYEKREKSVLVHVFINDMNERMEIDDDDLELSLPELQYGGYHEAKKRRVKRCEIYKSVLTGSDYIEKPRRIAGKILPIIPFYGYWAFVDGQEFYAGLVRKQKDPQRILNMQVSNLTELASFSPKESPIFAPEQVKGLEGRWAEAHLGKKNYHLARPLVDAQGNVIQSGPSGWVKPPMVDPATQGLIQFTTDHIRSTSGGMPQDVEDPEASGKAILAVQKRVDMHTYTIMDNIMSGMIRLGEAFISIAQEIYSEDNRRISTLQEDGTEQSTQLNSAEIEDGRIVQKHDLSSRRFEVYADVGPSYESQRRETIEFMKELLTVLPEGDPRTNAVISAIIDAMQGVGLGVIKDLNRKQMLAAGMVDPANEEEEQMLAELSQQNQEPEGLERLIESETARNFAEAQGQQAQNIERMASAEKKQAEAAKIAQSIGLDKMRMFLDALEKAQPQMMN